MLSFYINLRGKVSIYKHDEFDENGDPVDVVLKPLDLNDDVDENDGNSHTKKLSKSERLRAKLGNYIVSLGSGSGFGEMALVNDNPRNASIIAGRFTHCFNNLLINLKVQKYLLNKDEKTDLMIVDKTLYARSLQAPTIRRLVEKQNFINKSPFFSSLTPRMKRLLCSYFERDIVPYESYLGKQGDQVDRIYFIIGLNFFTNKNSLKKKF